MVDYQLGGDGFRYTFYYILLLDVLKLSENETPANENGRHPPMLDPVEQKVSNAQSASSLLDSQINVVIIVKEYDLIWKLLTTRCSPSLLNFLSYCNHMWN